MVTPTQLQIINNATFFTDIANKYPSKQRKEATHDLQDCENFVAVRIRPLLEGETSQGAFPSVYCNGPESVVAHNMGFDFKGRPSAKSTEYEVDAAFGPQHSNEEVYEAVAKPLVPWVLSGGVATLFAYGQTGSGKTYTVTALEKMVAAELFAGLNPHLEIFMCFFELLGNKAYDLLHERAGVSVMEDGFGVVQLVNIREHQITSADEFLALIEKGAQLRRTEETQKNHSSSRSHAMCRIRVLNKDVKEVEDGILFMVDLAGSEGSADTTQHNKERSQESRDINRSLSTLKDCIRNRAMLADPKTKHSHIPYRTARVTHILKDTFDVKSTRSSHSKTVVIANVAPSVLDTQQSLNTLKYIAPLKVVIPKSKLVFNPQNPATWSNKELREWIDNNSGTPPISSELLAPVESGKQLCRMPQGEFIARCMKTPNVNGIQARAFYDKVWKVFTDSRSGKVDEKKQISTNGEPAAHFKTRIRPGMFVSLVTPHPSLPTLFVMIMAPYEAEYKVADINAEFGFCEQREESEQEKAAKRQKAGVQYLCCGLNPSIMQGAYELHVKDERLVGINEMAEEVQVEYDTHSRLYYIVI